MKTKPAQHQKNNHHNEKPHLQRKTSQISTHRRSDHKQATNNPRPNRTNLESKHAPIEKAEPPIGVVVPFAYGRHKFRVIPSKPWGHYEHFLLHIIAVKPYSANDLAIETGLPHQLIIEIMIPFMRVGWITLIEQNHQYLFAATDRGISVSSEEELPIIKDPQYRNRSFVIDPITEECYRIDFRLNRNNTSRQPFQVFGKDKISKQLERHGQYAAKVIIQNIQSNPGLETIFSCVALAGEEVISFEQRPFDEPYDRDIRFAIAVVDEAEDISGMPEHISGELKDQIIKAARQQREKIKILGGTNQLLSPEIIDIDAARHIKRNIFPSYSILSNQYELVLGAHQHELHLYDMINQAQSRIIIHSTFIHPEKLGVLMPALLDAARRSVQVDIMWGQLDPDENDTNKLQKYQQDIEEMKKFEHNAYQQGLESFFKIHFNASGSHAKFIISDHKEHGYSTTLGSCNWLASGFQKFEASVCVHSLLFVADTINIASILARGKLFLANDLSQELARLSKTLKSLDVSTMNQSDTDNTPQAVIHLVTAGDHETYILKARDEATQEIFVCSHRVSQIADNSILPTISSNRIARKTAAYGRATGRQGGMTTSQANELKRHYEAKGFNIVVADSPQVHAKVLTWDTNHTLITSLNWLSASSHVEPLQELGVYIQDEQVSCKFLAVFEQENIKQD